MKVTECYIERTFNLGNYQSAKIGFTATVNEGDKPLDVAADIEHLIHQHYQNSMKPTEAPKTAPKPDTKVGTVCPQCGGKKKEGFALCYNCWESEKAQ